MPLKRFENLRSNLHFVDDNRLEENAPKLAKIQPIIDIVREQCMKVSLEESQFHRRTNYPCKDQVQWHSSVQL